MAQDTKFAINLDILSHICQFKSGIGNYFRPRATLGFYLCLVDQILVKCAFFKAKNEAFAGRMWSAGHMLSPPGLNASLYNAVNK